MQQLCTPRVARSAVSTLTINWSTVLRDSLCEFFMFFWLLKLLIWLRDAFGMHSADESFCLYCKVTTFADGNHTLACFSSKKHKFRSVYVCAKDREKHGDNGLVHVFWHLREQKLHAFGAFSKPWHSRRGGFAEVVFNICHVWWFVKLLIVSL